MATTIELEKKRAAERRLALLVLSGEQPPPKESCLDAEELAALVEGRLPAARVAPCLDHLAGCERCYALWLQLEGAFHQQRHTAPRNVLRRLIGRPRFFAAAGSLLAAAASIALVVTISLRTDRASLPGMTVKSAQEQTQPAPADGRASKMTPRAEQPAEEGELERTTLAGQRHSAQDAAGGPVPAPAAPPAGSTDRADALGTPGPLGENRASIDPSREHSRTDTAPVADAARAKSAEKPQPHPLATWLEKLRIGCQTPPSATLLADALRQGQQLLAKPAAASLSEEDQMRIATIVTLLEAHRLQPATEQCQALRPLLDTMVPQTGK